MSELEIWNELGNIYYNAGAYDESVRAYTKAIELDQGCERSYSNLASIYISRGRPDEAVKLLQKGIEHLAEEKDKAVLWNRLGEVYQSLEDADNAFTSFQKAVELDPEDAAFKENLANAQGKTSSQPDEGKESQPVVAEAKPVEAVETVEVDSQAPGPSMNRSSRERAEALLQAGIQQWKKMDYERASRFLNMARDIASETQDNRFEAACLDAIARVEADLGRSEIAIQAYESAASLDPEYTIPWNKLGALYSQLNQYDKALTTFQKAIEYSPKNAISWNGLGDVYHKLGRNEDAIAAYQLGNVFAQQGLDENFASSHPIKLDEDGNVHIWKELGDIYFEAEAYEDAIHAYTRAVQAADHPAEQAALWGRLGDIYKLLDNPTEATAAYNRAVELDPVNHAAQNGSEEAKAKAEHTDVEPEAKKPEPMIASDPETPSTESLASQAEESQENHFDTEEAYWIFKPRKTTSGPSRIKVQPSVVVAKTNEDADKSSPVAIPQFAEKAYADNALLLDTRKEADVLVAESSPKAEEAAVASQATVPQANEDSDTKPVRLSALGMQANRSGQRASSQLQKNPHSLESDIAAYRRVTEINPKNDRAWDALGNMYEAAGLHSEAIAAFEQAISLDPRKEVYYYHLGLAHAAQTHYEKAIQALQSVVELNPRYILAHCALAGYYRRINQEGKAQEHIAIARPIMENENEYNRACFESISGNADQALEFLKVALEKQQIQPDWVRNDPDLDFIRSNSRFEKLLNKHGNYAR